MKRYSPAVISPNRSILQSTVHNPSILTSTVSGVIPSTRSIQSAHHRHLPSSHRISTSFANGIHPTGIIHPISNHYHRVQPIVYGPQIIPPLKTNLFNGIYTTPTLAILSDKQIPIVGNYISNQPKLRAYIQDINPPHIQQPLSTKIIQATVKDIRSPQIIKITSQDTGEFYARGSQIGAFDGITSMEDVNRIRSRSVNNVGYSNTKILGDNIKISVYRSPDVVVKERELITDGPKLQKQHVLRVGVQGHIVPTYRQHNQQSVQVRDLTLNKQQTVIVHEPRIALDLLPPQRIVTQTSYEIKPTVTSVTLPTVAVQIPSVPVISSMQVSSHVETHDTYNYTDPYQYRQNITPIVHSQNIQATITQNVPFSGPQFTSPHIRDMMSKKITTPIKDLSAGGGKFDDSINYYNVGVESFEHSLQRQTNSFYVNGETPLAGLSYKIHDEQVGNNIETISSKLPQAKITQPLSFTPASFQIQTKPYVEHTMQHSQSLRSSDGYQGAPIRASDPKKQLLD